MMNDHDLQSDIAFSDAQAKAEGKEALAAELATEPLARARVDEMADLEVLRQEHPLVQSEWGNKYNQILDGIAKRPSLALSNSLPVGLERGDFISEFATIQEASIQRSWLGGGGVYLCSDANLFSGFFTSNYRQDPKYFKERATFRIDQPNSSRFDVLSMSRGVSEENPDFRTVHVRFYFSIPITTPGRYHFTASVPVYTGPNPSTGVVDIRARFPLTANAYWGAHAYLRVQQRNAAGSLIADSHYGPSNYIVPLDSKTVGVAQNFVSFLAPKPCMTPAISLVLPEARSAFAILTTTYRQQVQLSSGYSGAGSIEYNMLIESPRLLALPE